MLSDIFGEVQFLLTVAGIGLCLEVFWQREAVTIRDRVNGFRFWPFLITGQAICSFALFAAISELGVRPLWSMAWMPIPAQIFIALLGGDFLYYWYHRAQHRFLWQFHSVHHSIENLSSVNTFHHWLEPVFMTVAFIPAIFLLGLAPDIESFGIFWLYRAQTYIVHSPTRLHLGLLGKVIMDSRFHRIHHSIEPRHFDKNFGMLTPLWDVVFRTAYWPGKEWPAVGVVGHPEPRNLKEWFGWRLGRRGGLIGMRHIKIRS